MGDPARLLEHALAVGDVAERGVADDDIERLVAERELAAVGDAEVELGCERLRALDEDRRGIDPEHVARVAREPAADRAAAAADLQHPRILERDVGEVGLQHRALLGVGGSQFEDVGQLLLQRFRGLIDGGVHIRHGRSIAQPPWGNPGP